MSGFTISSLLGLANHCSKVIGPDGLLVNYRATKAVFLTAGNELSAGQSRGPRGSATALF